MHTHPTASHVFPRHTKAILPMVAKGDGCYLIDQQGKHYLDASGGAAVSCLGHSDAAVVAALEQQMARVCFAHTGFFTSAPAEALADLLVESAANDLARAYFVCGGSEAVEAALKLARQYYIEIGQPQRHRVIARQQSYHGNTLGALATGGNPQRRAPFAPLLMQTTHIPPCYAYRGQAAGESAAAYGNRMAATLEAELQRLPPDEVMAFVAEPVVGATLGAVAAVPGYFRRIREICDHYGVLLILDEVMCGMGRTGSLFAYEQEGIQPDIVTIAKGLGGGYQPIGAMLCSQSIYAAIESGSGFFQHGHTYLGHPLACTAGHAVLSAILERKLLPQVEAQGAKLRAMLNARLQDHPHVGDIRGRGLFIGVELVAERTHKTPFAADLGVHRRFKQQALDNGLVCYSVGGCVDGARGDHVLLAPPFIITTAQLAELTDKFTHTLEQVCAVCAPRS